MGRPPTRATTSPCDSDVFAPPPPLLQAAMATNAPHATMNGTRCLRTMNTPFPASRAPDRWVGLRLGSSSLRATASPGARPASSGTGAAKPAHYKARTRRRARGEGGAAHEPAAVVQPPAGQRVPLLQTGGTGGRRGRRRWAFAGGDGGQRLE